MTTFDTYVLIAFALCVILGAAFGFGRWLRWLTDGVVGKIISCVICYFLFGIVLSWSFVQALMKKLTSALQEDGGWLCEILLAIRLDLIVFAVVLFIAVQILRKLAVAAIARAMQVDFKPVSVINRLCGVVILIAFAAVVLLIAFQISAWVYGTDGGLYMAVQGSAFGLEDVYIDNPLNALFKNIRLEF